MIGYSNLMTAIIKKQIIILGSEEALKHARRVPGLVVTDDGQVVSEADQAALASLSHGYQKMAGTVAIMLMKSAIAPLLSEAHNLVLPEELR